MEKEKVAKKTTKEIAATKVNMEESKEVYFLKRDVMDKVSSVNDKMHKIAQIMERYLLDDYFEKYDNEKQEDHISILYEFSAAEINVGIISDYFFDSMRLLREIESLVK